jgi:hypothetical protein
VPNNAERPLLADTVEKAVKYRLRGSSQFRRRVGGVLWAALGSQLLAGIHIAAAGEAIALAKKLGLDLSKVYEVITASPGNSWMFENRVPHILDNDYSPKSAFNIFTEDLGTVSDMARAASFPTPLAASALQMFLMTAASGMGQHDDASVVRLYAKIAAVEVNAGADARNFARREAIRALKDDHI